MIQTGLWQDATLRDLIALLRSDERVRALVLKGSLADPHIQPDTWSDIDLTIVVADGVLAAFFPNTDWLAPLGEVYTFDQSSHGPSHTTRVCFTDFRRIDCYFIQESDFPRQTIQSTAIRSLFSRSSPVDETLAQATFKLPPAPEVSPQQFEHMVNQFWFKGMLTTSKVMRNDLLIATHLALELVQDTCVLAMLLRDRATGTSHHREGGMGNDFIAQLESTRQPYTPTGILDCVQQCSILFDTLAAQWSNDYRERRQPLLDWISYVKTCLKEQER